MPHPGKTVSNHETQRNKNKSSADQKPNEQDHRQTRPDKMQQTIQRLAMFTDIKIPKFRICFYLFFTHFFHKFSATIAEINIPTISPITLKINETIIGKITANALFIEVLPK